MITDSTLHPVLCGAEVLEQSWLVFDEVQCV